MHEHRGLPLLRGSTEDPGGGRQAPPSRDGGDGNTPPQPWTVERARAFTMPIGKYKGRTVAQIGLADLHYLK